MIFTWDLQKARINKVKHGVTFEEARSVFMDSRALLISDPDHSMTEDRYILLGMSWLGRLIVVHHVDREEAEVIRIFSARKAVKQEVIQYTRANI